MKDKMSTRLSQTPQEKVGLLTRDEVQCPICWSVLMEPVTLPCTHNLCLECFRNTLKENCLCCPCCRMRISNWSRRAEKQGGLVNQHFWKKIQDQFPRFVEARLLGQDSQDIIDEMENGSSENDTCLSVEVTPDSAKKKNSVVDVTTPGKIRPELQELYKKREDDAQAQKKLEDIANVDLIRKLKAEDGFATQQLIFDDSCDDESTDNAQTVDSSKKGGSEDEKSPQKNGQSKSLCRNLFSEWETGSSVEKPTTPEKVCGPKLLKAGTRRSSWHVPSTSSMKKINWKDNSVPTAEASSQERCLQDETLCSTTTTSTDATSGKSTTGLMDSSKNNVVSSFVPVCSPRMARTELPKPVNGARLSLDSRTADVKTKIDHSKRSHVHPSSDTPDSINIEVNSYFRPIRSAPKTPPKQLPDGSYLPEPRLVKSTPIRLGSAPPALMLLPSTFIQPNSNPKKSANKKLKLVDYDEDSSNDSNAVPGSTHSSRIFSPPPPILVHYALQGISPNEYLGCSPENLEGGRRTGPPPELEVYGSVDDNDEVSKERKMSDIMYRKVQAFQLEQFRKRKMQEDTDRKYAEKLQRELNKTSTSVRTRESSDRYSIRNWVGSPPTQPCSSDSLPSTTVPANKYKLRTTRTSTASDTSYASSVKNGSSKGLTNNKRQSTNSRIEPIRQSTRVTRSQSKRGRK